MKIVGVYCCAVCEACYTSGFEAENCCGDDDVTLGELYECEVCGERFELRDEADRHETFFCNFDSCRSCRHMDNLDGRRYEPCPQRGVLGGKLAACANYERAAR